MKPTKPSWRQRLSKWWHGELKVWDIPGVVGFHTERHWTSTAARTVVSFYMRQWQWVWSTLIAFVALVVSVKAI